MEFILIIIAVVIIAYIVIQQGQDKYIADEKGFSQNGVLVDFVTGTITINGVAYPVSKITGIKTSENHMRGEKLLRTAIVTIEMDDFQKPIHKVSFFGFSSHRNAEGFSQRLATAMRRAGGTSFV